MTPSIAEVILHFREGENQGVEIRVNPPRKLTIGRSEECDIFLGEKKISRKHCCIEVEKEGVKLVDLQSTNGTFLNKKKVGTIEIHHEDKVQVGTSVVEVLIHHQKEANAPEQESGATAKLLSPSSISEVLKDIPSMTEQPERESFSKVMETGEKALSPKEESDVVRQPTRPLTGDLSIIGLADLLQNFSQNRKSGILHLSSSQSGQITIVDGRLISAEVGVVKGEKALYRMLGWNQGDFELKPLPEGFAEDAMEKTISQGIESLLMEGFRQFDELEKIRKNLPPFSAQLRLKPQLKSPLSKLHPKVLDVLQVILNHGKVETVLDVSPLSDLETSKIIFYLLQKEYIESQS